MTPPYRLATPLLVALGLPACYLSYRETSERDAGPDRADAPIDTADVSDGAPDDADPPACDALRVAGALALDDAPASSVTPRLVALPDHGVGVVTVSTDGDPTRVLYERLDPALGRTIGPVTVATDSFTWAEPALAGAGLLIAFGLAGDEDTMLVPVTFDGAPAGTRFTVPLTHPSIFRPSRSGFFWLAFVMRTDNSFQLAHLAADGTLLHEPVVIDAGRYGSGHGAVARPDGASHVVTYPREGPPGVRNGYVNALTESGVPGPERQLGEAGDGPVQPVRLGDALVLVRSGDDALILERTDFGTLERLDRVTYPPAPTRPIAGAVSDRLLIAYTIPGTLRIDDYGTELVPVATLDVPLPASSLGPGWSVAEGPGALYLALSIVEGSRSYPWIVRVECAGAR
ncbi:MAG: hypothetical protein HY907_19155 [Deltaproteobacteria bacterium]|nr:hypothetical protein [Deltaproteobacteria bacterium]